MKRLPFALASSLVLLLVACGGEDQNLPPPPPPPPPPASAAPAPPPPADTSAVDAGAPAPAAPAPAVTLQAGAPSPDPDAKSLPTVKFVAPSKGQLVKSDKAADFEIKVDVKNWATATGSSHVHLILDNKPYKPLYDTKKPVKLSELTGGAALGDGHHVLIAFPSRANHESVKTKGAIAITDFWVGAKKGDAKLAAELGKPLLVYSRPKGDYNGDMANHVLVDFQLLNDTLGDDKDKVAISVTGPGIDGQLSATVTKFGTPYYLDNLQDGDYVVKVELEDKGGAPVPGSWNSTTRTIHVNHEAPTPTMPGMNMGGDAGAPASTTAPAK